MWLLLSYILKTAITICKFGNVADLFVVQTSTTGMSNTDDRVPNTLDWVLLYYFGVLEYQFLELWNMK